ncbi:SGNH hydrolase domain-containing protein [Aeromicrobium choanae]|uniref:SGNH domain-containing protein n=1 Tax=Aeromicrobium choanae TaxID=1736691 RepID=A0A1T4Z091_9ACTN|nr:SGNH hydrolase domain-containing protein [Aeromicrobium choanae]SKB07228.1 hypothetical protein SAMN06295964_1606 [Aeromicrobium choanae]
MLRGRRPRLGLLAGLALLLSAGLLSVGLLPAVADEPRLSSIPAAELDVAPGTEACFPGHRRGETQVLTCEYGSKGPRILAIGDSHLRAFSPALRRLAEEGRIRVTLVIRSRCGWSSRVVENDTRWIRDDCQTWRQNVARYIREQDDVRAIVTHHRASTMAGRTSQRGPDTLKAWRIALERGIPVIALSGAANWPFSGPTPTRCLRENRAPSQWDTCSASVRKVMKFDWTVPAVVLARRAYGPAAAHRIDLRDVYCPQRRCRAVTPSGQIMYRDHQHLTAAYSRSLAPLLERRLRETGVVFAGSKASRSKWAARAVARCAELHPLPAPMVCSSHHGPRPGVAP